MKEKTVFLEEVEYPYGEAAFMNLNLVNQIVIKKEEPLDGSTAHFDVLGFFERAKPEMTYGGMRLFASDMNLGRFETFEEARKSVEKIFTLKQLNEI